MKRLFLLTTILFTALTLVGSDKINAKIGEFENLVITGNIEVTLVHNQEASIDVTLGEGTESDLFDWVLKDKTLTLKLKKPIVIGSSKTHPSATATVNYTALKSIAANSSATILNKEKVKADVITLSAEGKASFAIDIDATDLTITTSSSSKMTVNGTVEYLNIKANTNSYVNTVTMECDNLNITAATNAECYVTSIKRFEAKATTNAHIFYKGAPEIVKTTTQTMGCIEHF